MSCSTCGGSTKTPYSPRYAKESGTLTFNSLDGAKSVNILKESYLLEEYFLKNEVDTDYYSKKKYQRDNFIFKSELFKANPDLKEKPKAQSSFTPIKKEDINESNKKNEETLGVVLERSQAV